MITKEKILEPKLKRKVEDLGGLCLKWVSPSFTGVPDRIILMPGGRIYFAEIKTTGKDLFQRQKFVKRQLERLGFIVWKVDSDVELMKFIVYLSKNKQNDEL